MAPADDFRPGCIASLSSARDVLARAVELVPADGRGLRPAPERWSVAEILEHLLLVETSVARLLRRAASAPAPDEPGPPVVPYDRQRVVDRSRRVEAFERARPTGALSWEQAWEALHASREELIHALEEADPARLGSLRFPHFIFGMFDGEAWARFVADHEERHADQIREVADALNA